MAKGKVFSQRYGSMFRIWLLRMVRGIEEGRVRGIEEGRAEERLNFLRILLKENSAFDISSKYGIPLNEVSAVERSLRL